MDLCSSVERTEADLLNSEEMTSLDLLSSVLRAEAASDAIAGGFFSLPPVESREHPESAMNS